MIQAPGVLMFVAWVLIGPLSIHHQPWLPTLILSTLSFAALGLTIIVRRSYRFQSTALLAALGIMFFESLLSIASWLHIELLDPSLVEREEVRHLLSFFFTLNVGLAAVGIVGAVGVALSLELRKSHLPLAKLFPEMRFETAPPEITKSVERLSKTMGVDQPKVTLIDSGDPAAFITRSKRKYVLAVSVGLLESLSTKELDACLAHELSHVKNNDFSVRSFATAARVALFAHPLGHLIEPAVYRTREFLADRTAADLVGRGALISALSKLRESQNYLAAPARSIGTACLLDSVGTNPLLRLFDKHPTLDKRISALQEQ
ncbi:MAG: M48 family metallopeptidase [Candidatus Bathyarchaeia archaeon]